MKNGQIKLLQVANYLIPGLSYQENIYCNLLSEDRELDNYIISVAKNYPNSGGYEKLANLFDDRDIKPGNYQEENVHSIRLEPLFEKNAKIWLIDLLEHVNEIDPDIILIHGVTNISTIRICLYKLFFRKKFRIIVDDHLIQGQLNVFKSTASRVYNFLIKFLFSPVLNKTIDLYLPISQETEDLAKKLYGAKGKFQVLPLGANDKIFYNDILKRKTFRHRHNLQSNEMLFIYTGKIIEHKGVDIIIESFARCVEINSKIKLFLVGVYDKKYYSKLVKLIDSLNLSDHVVYFDNVSSEELAEFYNGSDMGLWPFSETISVVEAQLCGLPAIVNNSTISMERVGSTIEKQSGIIVDNGEELLLALKQIVLNPEVIHKMKSRTMINSEKYKFSIIVNQIKEIIK